MVSFASRLGVSLLAFSGLASAWYQPSVATTWQVQYDGDYLDESYVADVYDIDGFNATSALITDLHNKYHHVICYIDAGSIENYRPDYAQFPAFVQGNVLDGWAEEKWLDIRQLSILQPLMLARATMAKSKGCDGIDWDNVDGYANDSGFNLSYADQIAYNTMLSTITHGLDMAVGLKNDLDQVNDLVSLFDFAVNESCQQYNECQNVLPFIQAGKPVWGINYSGVKKTSNCAAPNSMGIMMLLKTQALTAAGYACWQLNTVPATTTTLATTVRSSTAQTSSTAAATSSKQVVLLQAPVSSARATSQSSTSSSSLHSSSTQASSSAFSTLAMPSSSSLLQLPSSSTQAFSSTYSTLAMLASSSSSSSSSSSFSTIYTPSSSSSTSVKQTTSQKQSTSTTSTSTPTPVPKTTPTTTSSASSTTTSKSNRVPIVPVRHPVKPW